ncbi:Malto-oligosyltrehalose trehalohydrolase [Rhodovulum sp. PH10]|nr:Malto-oligosyltrehalose trehalohydrolase [Rhodovulum sp. PH10]
MPPLASPRTDPLVSAPTPVLVGTKSVVRAMPIGAELQPDGGAHFRVFAPRPKTIVLVVDDEEHGLAEEPGGYRSAFVPSATAGSRYGYRLDGEARILPDPASRFQPDGPHGLSAIVDPAAYAWRDGSWGGVRREDRHVVYEMHVGVFTSEGTWRAAIEQLHLLKDVGISVIEMMPVAEFSGRFGWGYDGVSMFAPTRLYGGPDDLRAFVDAAHGLGLGVILDVVYNHFGPDGNFLPCFADSYLTDRYDNEWGDAIDFDGPHAAPTREFVRENAAYWVREFHFDGLRLDATQQIFDASKRNIVAELTAAAREAGQGRHVFVVAENEPQDAKLVRPEENGGDGVDAVWNEDFHHTAHVTLTGRNEAYYSDYTGASRELLGCIRHGFLYQGQRSAWQSKPRGAPALDIDPIQRVLFLENHDQVANSGFGKRLVGIADPARLRAMTAVLLLAPGTAMLFQGQEFASTTPFLYFADHKGELGAMVAKGRREFLTQFPSITSIATDEPGAPETFRRCVIDWSQRETNGWAVRLHRDLISLRRGDPVFADPATRIDGATLSTDALLVRCFGATEERLLIVNFGHPLVPRIWPEPLLAPPAGRDWRLMWSSEHPDYGGDGAVSPLAEDGSWQFPGRLAVVMESVAVERPPATEKTAKKKKAEESGPKESATKESGPAR